MEPETIGEVARAATRPPRSLSLELKYFSIWRGCVPITPPPWLVYVAAEETLSAPAVETFLVSELQRFAPHRRLLDTDLATVLRRVDVREDRVHIVIDGAALFGDEHPDLMPSDLRQRLDLGEQAVSEDVGGIRVVLPRRLQLRGGRTVITGASAVRTHLNPGIISALKRAHSELLALNASPLTDNRQLSAAVARATQYERQLSRLAFLAPELQREILNGSQPRGLGLRDILKNEMPPAWADQRDWLRTIAQHPDPRG
ncbi:MAG: hypothetical protein JWQ29_2624 [Phenylobacterium sp.]|nr:hypothetical protein [Phenylobacterium sp.]